MIDAGKFVNKFFVIPCDHFGRNHQMYAFEDARFKIPKHIVAAIQAHPKRLVKATNVQAHFFHSIFEGEQRKQHVIVQSKSASGKSLAATVGMLNHLDVTDSRVQSLMLAPTDELAQQLYSEWVSPLASGIVGVKYALCVSGSQLTEEERKSHLLVATPRALSELLKKNEIWLAGLKCFVVDEAIEIITNQRDDFNYIRGEFQVGRQTKIPQKFFFFSTKLTPSDRNSLFEYCGK